MLTAYLSSPVSFYQRELNSQIANLLRTNNFRVLLPQEITKIKTSHKTFDLSVYERCIEMMTESNFGLLVYPYGRDCAWEAGYYQGTNKPIYAFVNKLTADTNNRIRDWMVKGGLTALISTDKEFLKELETDRILFPEQLHFITNFTDLPAKLMALHANYQALKSSYVGAGAVVIKENRVLLVKEKTDAKHYLRKKDMWGFPTTTIKNNSPEAQAVESLEIEANVKGFDPKYISTKSIVNASGIFYRVNTKDNIKENRFTKWFEISRVLNDEELYLRPTYREVLGDTLS